MQLGRILGRQLADLLELLHFFRGQHQSSGDQIVGQLLGTRDFQVLQRLSCDLLRLPAVSRMRAGHRDQQPTKSLRTKRRVRPSGLREMFDRNADTGLPFHQQNVPPAKGSPL